MEPETVITLRYESVAEVRRDRLPDVERGVIARTRPGIRDGDVLPARIELVREGVTVELRARVRWATPLATGTLAGLELEGPSRREEVQLDLLLGIRAAVHAEHPEAAPALRNVAPRTLPRLSIVVLEPNKVLREVLAGAFVRFARGGKGWNLQLAAVATTDEFLAALAERRRDLAVVDCDGIASADPLVQAIRSHEQWSRMPVVLLSRTRSAGLEDRYTVTMQKPVAIKALLNTSGLLLADEGMA